MVKYNREDPRTALPQIEKQMKEQNESLSKRVEELERIVQKTARISGDVRENTAWTQTGNGNVMLQMKRTTEDSLMLTIYDDGRMRLQSVPYVDGEDDWSHATTVWTVDMKNL